MMKPPRRPVSRTEPKGLASQPGSLASIENGVSAPCRSANRGQLLKPLDFGGENIAAAAHRLNHRRVFGVVSEPAPKPAELYVDRPNERPSLAMAGEIEQLGSAQHLIGVVDERREQIECASGQPDLFA